MREELLRGAYDLHVHTAPDIVPRKIDHVAAARRCAERGMAGFAIKSHYAMTADRAEEAARACPACRAVAGIVLNTTQGGINPAAVEYALRVGAKIVWFPTMDAPEVRPFVMAHAPDLVAMQATLQKQGIALPDTSVLDEAGQLRDAVRGVLAVAKRYGAVVATGHISHRECFAVAEEACRQGVERLVITHANLPATRYTVSEQKRLIDMGAIIERSYIVLHEGMIDAETEAREIAAVGPEHVLLSSDLGRPDAPFFDDGMLLYANALCGCGVSENDVHRMLAENPAALIR